MSKIYTRVQNEKFVAAQNNIIGSVTETLNALFAKAFYFSTWTNDTKSYIAFDVQEEDGSIRRETLSIPSMLCNFGDE
jgi:hypothetical protein